MGLVVNGVWEAKPKNETELRVNFKNPFNGWLGSEAFLLEGGRYHLLASYACPWAHRAIIGRALLNLEASVSLSIVSPRLLEHGWSFGDEGEHDMLYQYDFLHQYYTKAKADYTGKVSVPVLWDKKTHTIVSSESADILRMFSEVSDSPYTLYPETLSKEIASMIDYLTPNINAAVYNVGFATEQMAYDKACDALFAELEKLDYTVSKTPYILGSTLTAADIHLFTTLIRFDTVYYLHFKCNQRMIEDFTHLSHYVRRLYQTGPIASTVNFEHIKTHYYYSHRNINPNGIIAKGPTLDYHKPAIS